MKSKLIELLQNAHAGERAAAFAYNGHWRAVTGNDVVEIRKIELEEWEHRECLEKMLIELGSGPRLTREVAMFCVGVVIFTLCRLGGWLNIANFGWYMSMYGAGKLESGNIQEYLVAAQWARDSGYSHFIKDLKKMSDVEKDHEIYFRNKCLSSKWSKYLKTWD